MREKKAEWGAAINIKIKGMDSVLKSCGDICISGVNEARIPCLKAGECQK